MWHGHSTHDVDNWPSPPSTSRTAPDLPLGKKKRTLLHQSFHWDWLPCLEETHLDSGRKQPSSWKDSKDRKKYLAAIQECWDATTKKPPMTLGATKDVEQTLSPFKVVLTGSLGWNRPENVVPFVRKITGVVPIMLLSSMGKHKKCFKRCKKIE